MLEQFLRHLSENKLASAGDKILLAVSGGLDSIVMLDLFVKAGFSCHVAHVNFQLRGEESDEDESFVRKCSEQYGVPCYVRQAHTSALSAEKKISIQMAARELRYAWFQSLLDEMGFHSIATAHHLNDSLETVLFNWMNGSSLAGLTGIPVKNDKIIRPLLFATRKEIELYARHQNLAWREDSSNKTDDYTRNFIRHQVIDKLKEINPSLETTFSRGQRKLAGELAFYERALRQWKEQFVQVSPNRIVILKSAFNGMEHGASILHKAIQGYGFNFDVCEEIIRSLEGQSGKKFNSSSHLLVIDRDFLLLTPFQSPWMEVHVEKDQQEACIGTWTMRIKESESLLFSAASSVAVLDASKLQFPLVWRVWKQGDFFYPLGMEKRKKLSDFLIDEKIPVSEKQNITVLESGGELVWVVGYRIDNRFRLTKETTRALAFTVTADFS